jgi:1,4-dihydroxy-2-naphthoyl-CoA synthase
MGLVNKVVPVAELEAEGVKWAARFSGTARWRSAC